MANFKFKVGDRVRIKKRTEKHYKGILFNDEMEKKSGKITKIATRSVVEREGSEVLCYGLESVPWFWVEHWLEPVGKMPKRPEDFLPGDRVQLVKTPNSQLPIGSKGTVIGTWRADDGGTVVAVDWAPWQHGHNDWAAFEHLGYPKGTTLPGKTGFNVRTQYLKVIQRGNTVYEEE
jgi:hypothetical protein